MDFKNGFESKEIITATATVTAAATDMTACERTGVTCITSIQQNGENNDNAEKGNIVEAGERKAPAEDEVEKLNQGRKKELIEGLVSKKEADTEEQFPEFWPFSFSQSACDAATEYLTKINNSHILTQLIANYKIIKLGVERGLHVGDGNILHEVGNVPMPDIDDKDLSTDPRNRERDEEYEHDEVSTYDQSTRTGEDANSSDDDYDDNDNDEYSEQNIKDHSSIKKINKRKVLNNKRRKINKKNKKLFSQLRSEDWQTDQYQHQSTEQHQYQFTDGILNEGRDVGRVESKVSFSLNDDSDSVSNSNNNDNNDNNYDDNYNGTGNYHCGSSIVTDKENSFDSRHDHDKDNSQTTVFTVLRVRDLALKEENSKSIRVHEYFKKWRIFDLDVVY